MKKDEDFISGHHELTANRYELELFDMASRNMINDNNSIYKEDV